MTKTPRTFLKFVVPAIFAVFGAVTTSAAPDVHTASTEPTLAEARKGFSSNLIRKEADNSGRAIPAPKELYDTIQYNAPLGKQDAYVSVNPNDGKKQPAIIWIPGGFTFSIKQGTATEVRLPVFASAGIVGMLPSLRGGNANPGCKEYFLGEIDDILAAADHLAQLPYVDKDRIYLAGTSTGGTMALLAAESTGRFRAVFAYGPAAEVSGYDHNILPFDSKNGRETKLRSPLYWMHGIKTPTFVMEGNIGANNLESLNILKQANRNPLVKFLPVPGATHRNVPDVINPLIARRILLDTRPACTIELSQEDVNAASKDFHAKAEPASRK